MTPWVRRILVANGALFLMAQILPEIAWPLVLVPALLQYRPWSMVTYMFLHFDVWHLLFNMLGLFFFGPPLEVRLGGRRFLTLYLVSGISGALLSLLTTRAGVVGASGAVFGIFLGYALYWPHERVYIWGVIPVPARVLVVALTVLSLYGAAIAGGGIAHFAHLGGFLGGLVYLRWSERCSAAARFRSRAESASPRPTQSDLKRWQRIRPETMHPVNRAEYERLRRKIEDGGVEGLTPSERASLDRFSSDLADTP